MPKQRQKRTKAPKQVKLQIVLHRPDNPSSVARITENEKEPDLTREEEKTLELIFQSEHRMTQELEAMAQGHNWLDGGKVSMDQARHLREKIVRGFFEWAIEAMGKDLERYLAEGEKNFLSHFTLHCENPYRTDPIDKTYFINAFERSQFIVPRNLPRTDSVHPNDWPSVWKEYNIVCNRIRKIPLSTRRQRGCYLMALKQKLPGISDKLLMKLVDKGSKPSDIAAEYVSRNSPARGQAFKEYFNVFHRRYGYLDLLAARHNKLK